MQQKCAPLLMAVLNLPFETKQIILFITAVTYALKVVTVMKTHYYNFIKRLQLNKILME